MDATASFRQVTGRRRFRNTMRIAAAIALGHAGLVLAPAVRAAAADGLAVGAEGIIGQTDVGTVLEIRDIDSTDARVRATLVNNSGSRIKDIQVVVRHAFLWKDERNPGRDNPGRTEFFLVLGEVEPHGRLAFEYRPEPPLPQRADGTFKTSIEIAGFTEVGAE